MRTIRVASWTVYAAPTNPDAADQFYTFGWCENGRIKCGLRRDQTSTSEADSWDVLKFIIKSGYKKMKFRG